MLRKENFFQKRPEAVRKTRDVLIKSRLFGGLPEEHITEIEKIAIGKNYKKGDVIFHDGDEGNGFYLIAEGSVSVYKLSPDGREQVLHLLGEGETVGAAPVFSGKSFPANARALTPCRLLFFDRRKFIELIAGKPELTMNLLALLSARLREFTVQVESLSLKEIPGRLAAYLLYLAGEQKNKAVVKLPVSKVQIAGLLGTGPESLSRALGHLKVLKFIEEENNNIRLLNFEGLQELAGRGKIDSRQTII
jgi:CRP/FNR family transcriptional regulator